MGKKAKFTVECLALYHATLEVPENLEEGSENLLAYIREHLGDAKMVEDPEWLKDLEPEKAVTIEDLRGFEEVI